MPKRRLLHLAAGDGQAILISPRHIDYAAMTTGADGLTITIYLRHNYDPLVLRNATRDTVQKLLDLADD
jgi:hypothetical protein